MNDSLINVLLQKLCYGWMQATQHDFENEYIIIIIDMKKTVVLIHYNDVD